MTATASEVRIPIAGATLGADHLPAVGEPLGGRRACVVMAHGFANTRDSGLPGFARALAAGGLDVLAFDYRGFGTSSGEPRQDIDPTRQREDYKAAIAYARALPDVERIVLWGVSYSGGHVLQVAAQDGDVAAVISLTPAPDGAASLLQALRNGGMGGLRLTVAGLLDALAALRGAERVVIPAIGAPGALAPITAPGALEGMKRMAGPTFRNEVTARIALIAGAYRPIRHAERIGCPVLIQVADEDSTAPVSAAMRAAWLARAEVRHYPCDHFDVYPDSEFFEPVVEHQLLFLRGHLSSR
ncbi:MAG TPA: alpha/beta hydrolase [Solirubrobacteraceae bacterium]|jgi:pimeloyl-ACP methyl ester carboxylesterase|nr:alpha/beta hydrolase [Solirubrobacteraceae bacterium]